MAVSVRMRHPRTGIVKQGFHGFSYTYMFFGFWVPLLRGHYSLAMTHFAIWFVGVLTLTWLPVQILLAFYFNKFYTRRLLEDGYEFFDDFSKVEKARAAIGVEIV